MPSNHLILCYPLLLLPLVFPNIIVFSNESALHIRWPKYWIFSLSISPSNEYPGLVSFRMDWLISLHSKGLSRVFSNTTLQKHQFLRTQLSCLGYWEARYKRQLAHYWCISSVQLLSHVRFFATPWTAACQASLSITNSRSAPKPMSIKSVMPFNHLILCHPLLLLPSIFPSIRVFSNESALFMRWPEYWSFSFNISPSNQYSGLISFSID